MLLMQMFAGQCTLQPGFRIVLGRVWTHSVCNRLLFFFLFLFSQVQSSIVVDCEPHRQLVTAASLQDSCEALKVVLYELCQTVPERSCSFSVTSAPSCERHSASVRRKSGTVRSQWRAQGRDPTSAIAACDQAMLDGSDTKGYEPAMRYSVVGKLTFCVCLCSGSRRLCFCSLFEQKRGA